MKRRTATRAGRAPTSGGEHAPVVRGHRQVLLPFPEPGNTLIRGDAKPCSGGHRRRDPGWVLTGNLDTRSTP
jgi:hypothetical protein